MFRRISTTALFAALLVLGAPALAEESPNDEETAEETGIDHRPRVHDGFGLRGGLLLNGMFASELPLFLRYFDLGLRYKSGEYYLEARAPALTVIADGLVTVAMMFLRDTQPRLALESLNAAGPTAHLLAHWELAHGRMGYRFLLVPPGDLEVWSEPLEASIGVFGTADVLMFDLRRNIDTTQAQEYGYSNDPVVFGAGAFAAVGRTRGDLQYEIGVGVGRAIRGLENDPRRTVTIITGDVDFQYAFGAERFALYLRPRITAYLTQLDPSVNVGAGLTSGVTVGF